MLIQEPLLAVVSSNSSRLHLDANTATKLPDIVLVTLGLSAALSNSDGQAQHFEQITNVQKYVDDVKKIMIRLRFFDTDKIVVTAYHPVC